MSGALSLASFGLQAMKEKWVIAAERHAWRYPQMWVQIPLTPFLVGIIKRASLKTAMFDSLNDGPTELSGKTFAGGDYKIIGISHTDAEPYLSTNTRFISDSFEQFRNKGAKFVSELKTDDFVLPFLASDAVALEDDDTQSQATRQFKERAGENFGHAFHAHYMQQQFRQWGVLEDFGLDPFDDEDARQFASIFVSLPQAKIDELVPPSPEFEKDIDLRRGFAILDDIYGSGLDYGPVLKAMLQYFSAIRDAQWSEKLIKLANDGSDLLVVCGRNHIGPVQRTLSSGKRIEVPEFESYAKSEHRFVQEVFDRIRGFQYPRLL